MYEDGRLLYKLKVNKQFDVVVICGFWRDINYTHKERRSGSYTNGEQISMGDRSRHDTGALRAFLFRVYSGISRQQRILENQVRGGIPNTKQLMLKKL